MDKDDGEDGALFSAPSERVKARNRKMEERIDEDPDAVAREMDLLLFGHSWVKFTTGEGGDLIMERIPPESVFTQIPAGVVERRTMTKAEAIERYPQKKSEIEKLEDKRQGLAPETMVERIRDEYERSTTKQNFSDELRKELLAKHHAMMAKAMHVKITPTVKRTTPKLALETVSRHHKQWEDVPLVYYKLHRQLKGESPTKMRAYAAMLGIDHHRAEQLVSCC